MPTATACVVDVLARRNCVLHLGDLCELRALCRCQARHATLDKRSVRGANELDVGVVSYTDAETGNEEILALANGFLEVSKNQVSILADSAEMCDEIDLDRCQDALKRAEDRVSVTDGSVDLYRAQQALKRAYTRIQVRLRKFTF